MRNRLAGGQAKDLIAIDRTRKERTEDINHPTRLGEPITQPIETPLVPAGQPIEPGMQAIEGFVVRRQHQEKRPGHA